MNAIKKVTRITKKKRFKVLIVLIIVTAVKKVELLAHYFETLVNYSTFEVFPVLINE
jgi:hypothetical protein